MKAMVLEKTHRFNDNPEPLRLTDVPTPEISDREILLKVRICGVCHTELDEIEGRTPPPVYPMILGHQVVGEVVEMGRGARIHALGSRIGVGWIYASCGKCPYCLRGDDNLCADFLATGRDAPGGYAEFMKVPEDSAIPIPDVYTDSEAAPLLCAGAIGYRSLRLTNLKDGDRIGLTGFGASGHLVLKMVAHLFPNTDVYVFARSEKEQIFARELGAVWAGDTTETSPEKLNSIIDTTPVWKPVVEALDNLMPGGRLVINAIRKEDVDKDELLRIDYPRDLWMEKEIKSVANVAKRDISEFLKLAAEIPIKPDYEEFDLKDANIALNELKNRKIRGAKVLVIG
ncbi:MAG: zinc-dependent alcohol dehydrogenase family protein [candidate division KSB1 bacterium]|nr:zinc-dependent alcohol dehydrogenase family protein [candidate division KSB1 bacterium]